MVGKEQFFFSDSQRDKWYDGWIKTLYEQLVDTITYMSKMSIILKTLFDLLIHKKLTILLLNIYYIKTE